METFSLTSVFLLIFICSIVHLSSVSGQNYEGCLDWCASQRKDVNDCEDFCAKKLSNDDLLDCLSWRFHTENVSPLDAIKFCSTDEDEDNLGCEAFCESEVDTTDCDDFCKNNYTEDYLAACTEWCAEGFEVEESECEEFCTATPAEDCESLCEARFDKLADCEDYCENYEGNAVFDVCLESCLIDDELDYDTCTNNCDENPTYDKK